MKGNPRPQDDLVDRMIRFIRSTEWPDEAEINALLAGMLADDTLVHQALVKMTAGMTSKQKIAFIHAAARRIEGLPPRD